MLASSVLLFAFAALGMAQAPAGYKTVYLTSKVDAKLTIVPKAATAGSIIQVSVQLPQMFEDHNTHLYNTVKHSPTQQHNNGISRRGTAQSNWQVLHSAWMEVLRVRLSTCFHNSARLI
jgi:hypothetical protein